MPRLRVNLLGRTLVEVDGREAGLTPIAKAVLIRLVFAQGSAVFVNEIFHDVWAIAGPVHRQEPGSRPEADSGTAPYPRSAVPGRELAGATD